MPVLSAACGASLLMGAVTRRERAPCVLLRVLPAANRRVRDEAWLRAGVLHLSERLGLVYPHHEMSYGAYLRCDFVPRVFGNLPRPPFDPRLRLDHAFAYNNCISADRGSGKFPGGYRYREPD
jgi:hypothetical protein